MDHSHCQKMLAFVTLLLAHVAITSAMVRPVEHMIRRKQCPIASACFAIDQSGSIEPHYGTAIEFVIGIAAALDNRRRDVSYSAVGFSDNAAVLEPGTKRLPDFIQSLVGTEPTFGRTNVYAGLSTCFSLQKNKPGKHIIVIITDGVRTAGESASQLAGMINRAGNSFVIAVGIGPDVDHNQLTPLVATGSFYFPTTFKDLPKRIPDVAETICG